MNINKKHIISALVFLLLALTIVYRLLNPFVQPKVDQLTFTGQKNSIEKSSVDLLSQRHQNPTDSPISIFLNKPKVSGKVYKDLFSIYTPPGKKKLDLIPKQNITVPENIESEKQDPILTAKEYIASYRFYGMYKSEGKKAIFLSKDKLVLVARTGDRLDGKYLIDDIQDNYIRIKALDINEIIHLDMREFNNE